MKKRNYYMKYILQIMLTTCLFLGCKKQDAFLAAIPRQSLTAPNTLTGLQALLNNDYILNGTEPGEGVLGSDEYFVTDATYLSSDPIEQNIYTWQSNPYPNQDVAGWSDSYYQINIVNTVLDNLPYIKVSGSDVQTSNAIRGTALFFRAKALFNLLQLFSPQYDSTTADQQLGVVLRLNSDLTIIPKRSSLKECYDQLLNDLQIAIPLLPASTQYPTLPNIFAAHGLLARTYLVMGKYSLAVQSADNALKVNSQLNDYNKFTTSTTTLTSTNQYPLIEDQFHCVLTSYGIGSSPQIAIVDPALYASYDNNDLRKTCFFDSSSGIVRSKSSYEFKQQGYYYSGVAIDEMYLIRAECNARLSNVSAALSDLNTLLQNRYKTSTFTSLTISDPLLLLQKILSERKKELIFRGLRWSDLRRLNADSRFAKTLTRVVKGTTYTLPPGDLRYTLLIPDREIKISGIVQNPR
jgi:tetratricopeptide (TPR) repeat protein